MDTNAEKWMVAAKKADFTKIAEEFGISPVLARIIRNRDVEGSEEIHKFLYGSKRDLYEPELLKDMEKGIALLEEAVADRKKIRVIGDYDVDGICAAHIFCSGLKKAGALVDTAIPHRKKDGYGLNEHLIREAKEDGCELIVTCDNGIAARESVTLAKELEMQVLVTDHHEVPYTEEEGKRREILPEADAVIDPKQEGCAYPFPGICGAVVALKVIQAFFRKTDREREEEIVDTFLPFAAFATVCDVMELRDENRLIVKEGLKRLRLLPCIGLRALMQVNGLEPARLNAYHLGFVLGPCINSTGRLDTAIRALELLQCTDLPEAVNLASELKELNDSRKAMTVKAVEEAKERIVKEGLAGDKVLVVYLPDCHESLAGIIAGRLREVYNKPVFVLTDSEDGVKGSGRSIDAYHMFEEMVKCGGCFTKFGGHKMAAGLSMEKEKIGLFRTCLNERCGLKQEDYVRKVHIDVPMPLSYADLDLAMQMELLEPFGTANPKPLFAQKDVIFMQGRKMGANGNFARYGVLDDTGKKKELVYFGDLEKFHTFLQGKYGQDAVRTLYAEGGRYPVSITYQIGVNVYRGAQNLQIVMQDYM